MAIHGARLQMLSVRNLTHFFQMYIEMVHDHDIREDGVPAVPDFSVCMNTSNSS